MMTASNTRTLDPMKLLVAIVLLVVFIVLLIAFPAPQHSAAPQEPLPPAAQAEAPSKPAVEPTAVPTAEPTAEPTTEPIAEPTAEPTIAPEPTAEPTPEPTVEPITEPTAEPTSEPAAAAEDAVCATILAARLETGMTANVLSTVNMRSAAVIGDNILRANPPGTQLEVTGASVCVPHGAGAYRWWLVTTGDGVEGWTAEGTLNGSAYFLEPVE